MKFSGAEKLRIKDVSNPNIAKLLQRKRQMEDTGGDYIYEEDKSTPGSRSNYHNKKDNLRGISRQGNSKQQTQVQNNEEYNYDYETHSMLKPSTNCTAYNLHSDLMSGAQFPALNKNMIGGGEIYYQQQNMLIPKPPVPMQFNKEKSMVF